MGVHCLYMFLQSICQSTLVASLEYRSAKVDSVIGRLAGCNMK